MNFYFTNLKQVLWSVFFIKRIIRYNYTRIQLSLVLDSYPLGMADINGLTFDETQLYFDIGDPNS